LTPSVQHAGDRVASKDAADGAQSEVFQIDDVDRPVPERSASAAGRSPARRE
jgi:hypothetical protein